MMQRKKMMCLCLCLLTALAAQAQQAPAPPIVNPQQKAFIDGKIHQYTSKQCAKLYDDDVRVLPPVLYDARTSQLATPEKMFSNYYTNILKKYRQLPAGSAQVQTARNGDSFWFLINQKGHTTFLYGELNQRVMRVSGCVVE